MTTADQQIALSDLEAREQASGLIAAMRNDFNEARVEFTKQKLMPKHYESREVSNQLSSQEVYMGRTKDLRCGST